MGTNWPHPAGVNQEGGGNYAQKIHPVVFRGSLRRRPSSSHSNNSGAISNAHPGSSQQAGFQPFGSEWVHALSLYDEPGWHTSGAPHDRGGWGYLRRVQERTQVLGERVVRFKALSNKLLIHPEHLLRQVSLAPSGKTRVRVQSWRERGYPLRQGRRRHLRCLSSISQ